MDDDAIVKGLTSWCDHNQVRTDGVLVLTVQKNRTTEFASVVVDMDSGKLHPNFPAELLTSYEETRAGDLLVCYKAGLSLPAMFTMNTSSIHSSPSDGPFGCSPSELSPYKHRRTAHDRAFEGFVSGNGNFPDLVFEVKKQVDNGPLISTKFFKLENDTILEATGPFTQKVHCFKNYKCVSQNLFFGVDLYRADRSTGGNYHHMRLNPFTKVNADILSSLFPT